VATIENFYIIPLKTFTSFRLNRQDWKKLGKKKK
jgi:hypothetical protein